MAEELRIVLPKEIYDKIKEKAESRRITVNDIILMAITKVLEEL